MKTVAKSALVATTALIAIVSKACTHTPERTMKESSTSALELYPHPAFAQTGSKQAVNIADIAERTTASVINISSVKVVRQSQSPYLSEPFFRHFFEDCFRRRNVPSERRERSPGSGVIVSKDGVVLTNNHVIDKADEIKVHLHDGREFKAKVVGSDPKSDLAVLRVVDKPGDLQPIKFGNSDSLRLGDVVLAIGNPFGVGQTVTMGIVSAKGRANVGIVDYEDFIQTDAAINPGNSGGALVSMSGELIGINTAILSRSGGYQGIGFAIPSNMARAIQKSILKHGKVVRSWLGVGIQDVTPELGRAMDFGGRKGVLVSDVQVDSPAEKAGLKRGDLILSINGRKTGSTGKLRNAVANAGAGAQVAIKLLRKGSEMTLQATLGELSGAHGGVKQLQKSEGVLGGLTLGPIDAQTRSKFKLPERLRQGVVVLDVMSGSPSSRAGIRSGDVLVEINRQAITAVKSFTKVYKIASGQILLLVYRNGSTMYLLLRK